MRLELWDDPLLTSARERYQKKFNAPFPCYELGDQNADEVITMIDYFIETNTRISQLASFEIEHKNLEDEYLARFDDTVGAMQMFKPLLPDDRYEIMRLCIKRGRKWDIHEDAGIPEDAII